MEWALCERFRVCIKVTQAARAPDWETLRNFGAVTRCKPSHRRVTACGNEILTMASVPPIVANIGTDPMDSNLTWVFQSRMVALDVVVACLAYALFNA